MKALVIGLAILIASAAGIQLVLDEPGYALLAYGTTSVEMSLFVFSLALLISFMVFYVVVASLGRIWHFPGAFQERSQLHRRQKARDGLARGLTALAEGRWRDAEKALVRSARHSSVPMLHYLASAQAAQMQGDADLVELYLGHAAGCDPSSALAVDLARAESAVGQQQYDRALAVLRQLIERVPRGGYEVVLMARILARVEAWSELLEILPQLRHRRELSAAELAQLTHSAVCGALDAGAAAGDLGEVQSVWARLNRDERANPAFATRYVEALRALGEPDKAEVAIRGILDRHWNEELARLYGVLDHSAPSRALRHAEGWLKAHGDSASLLLSLGRLCCQAQLWGKARIYFESSLGQQPDPETYQELARLLQQVGETERAEECFRKGLRLAVEGIAEPLDEHPEAKQRPVKEAHVPQTDVYPV